MGTIVCYIVILKIHTNTTTTTAAATITTTTTTTTPPVCLFFVFLTLQPFVVVFSQPRSGL
jgi:hypothetical protein